MVESKNQSTKDIEYIQRLINNGDLFRAQELVQQYRRMAPDTFDFFSIEAVIMMMTGDLVGAEQLIRLGLVLRENDPDLLFNFGYIFEMKGLYSQAIEHYLLAKKSGNFELVRAAEEGIARIESVTPTLPSNDTKLSVEDFRPKVSVLIPTYNMSEYLQDAIESVLAQDFNDIEIVVGDDCSTDDTYDVMQQYASNPKVRYIRNESNLGSSGNSRSLLYEHVRGEYILGINHDDYLIETDYIKRAVDILDKNPDVSLVFANVQMMNVSKGKITFGTTYVLPQIMNGVDYFLQYQQTEFPPIPSTLTSMYRLDSAIRMGCLSENVYSQDTFLYLKLMLTGDIAFIESQAGVYRMHDKSLTYNMPMDKDLSTIVEFERLYSFAVLKGLDQSKLTLWLQIRIHNYLAWRINNTWNVNKQYALELLFSITKTYPNVFKEISSAISSK